MSDSDLPPDAAQLADGLLRGMRRPVTVGAGPGPGRRAGRSEGAPLRTTRPAAPAPESIDLYFDSGGAAIRRQDLAELDHAARLYREGHPILRTVTGGTDATGSPRANVWLNRRVDIPWK